MDIIKDILNFFIHLDHHIAELAANYGSWIYAIVFGIIFCETGLVVTPFLPGDSLLFVLGAITAKGDLNIVWLWVLLTVAAILGDALNYTFGKILAPKITEGKAGFIKQAHLDQTAAFFQKHGKKTIILARFVPIVRTFAPFLAGAGQMTYPVFALYNVIGAILWVTLGLGAGYLFGNIPFVAKNFSVVVLGIVVVSLIPAVIEIIKHKQKPTTS